MDFINPFWMLILGVPVLFLLFFALPLILLGKAVGAPMTKLGKDSVGQVVSDETQVKTNIYDYQGRGPG